MGSLRKVDMVVLSDIHLGTYGCQAKDLLAYLKSIDPKCVILNGDIIDIWQFKKRYWPKSHMKVIRYLLKWIVDGKEIYYLTGNHDEMLRKFNGFRIGNMTIANKAVLDLDGEKAWFFHGDVFDVSMQYSKWLTRLGGIGYDFLILLNSLINTVLEKIGKNKLSLSKTIKNSVKSAVKYINQFEMTAVSIAASKNYRYVVCGHIHHPNIESYQMDEKKVTYLNSGDWVENQSALEYHKGKWSLYNHEPERFETVIYTEIDKTNKELFAEMLAEFNMLKDS
ncbi:MAG: UDP-2,3-diacylglucosamine diphosphatase [Flavobacteriaceae bacterium]